MISPVHTWVAEKTDLREKLDNNSLSAWQFEKLKKLTDYARSNTRFYHGLPDLVKDIGELPFTSAADISSDPMAFLAIPHRDIERITTLTTSGTTGIKKRIFFSRNDLERIIEFFAVGMRTLTSGGQHTLILISDETINSLGHLLKSALARIGVTSQILSGISDSEAAIAASWQADCLVGMPAELLYMCRMQPDLRPKSILLTADYVPESVIDSIQKTWRCNVFTHYGMTETGFGYAVDCECHSGHHTRDAEIIVEVIDPLTHQPARPGRKGEIVLTMLSNEAMPLIRYRTGDISYFIDTPCQCGSNLKRLGRIESRFGDDVSFGNGQFLSIRHLEELLFSFPYVKGFEASLVQSDQEDHLYLVIDSSEKIEPHCLSSSIPPGLKIIIHYSVCDPFSSRGKRRLHRDLGHPLFSWVRRSNS